MKKVQTTTTSLLMKLASKKNFNCTAFDDEGFFIVEKNGKHCFNYASLTANQNAISFIMLKNKYLTKQVLKHFNIPTARYVFVSEKEELSKLKILNYPLIMKPIKGSRSDGVVLDIENFEEAKQAYQNSEKNWVLFEEKMFGREYRITIIKDKFFAVVYKEKPFVIGDGSKTISQLIKEKNKKIKALNLEVVHEYRVNKHLEKRLSKQKLNLDSVPRNKQRVELSEYGGCYYGTQAHDVTKQVCQENIDFFKKLVETLKLHTVGIDFICDDISKPAKQQKTFGIVELNACPGLIWHSDPMKGEVHDPFPKLLELIEKEIKIDL